MMLESRGSFMKIFVISVPVPHIGRLSGGQGFTET